MVNSEQAGDGFRQQAVAEALLEVVLGDVLKRNNGIFLRYPRLYHAFGKNHAAGISADIEQIFYRYDGGSSEKRRRSG